MYTYQQEFICHYSRLSSVLDMDSVISQQSLREVQLVLFSVLDRAGNSGQRHDVERGFLIKYLIKMAEGKRTRKNYKKSSCAVVFFVFHLFICLSAFYLFKFGFEVTLKQFFPLSSNKAFSSPEVQLAKARQEQLLDFQRVSWQAIQVLRTLFKNMFCRHCRQVKLQPKTKAPGALKAKWSHVKFSFGPDGLSDYRKTKVLIASQWNVQSLRTEITQWTNQNSN